MPVISYLKLVFNSLTSCMSYTVNFQGYTFSLGAVLIGGFMLSCSIKLLIYLFKNF